MEDLDKKIRSAIRSHERAEAAIDELKTCQISVMRELETRVPLSVIARKSGMSLEHLCRVKAGSTGLTISTLRRVYNATEGGKFSLPPDAARN
jgi:DNA-binding phage protein